MMQFFFAILFFAILVSTTDILLPLYVYPGTNAAAWAPITKVITAYPDVQWQIVINPHTGPGTNSSNPYPNDDYIAGIEALDHWSNVRMLGYVDTQWGRRAESDVKSDIDKYAAWTKYSSGDIGMDGIFFDDVPSIYDFRNSPGTQSTNETYFESISSYAHSTISSSDNSVICNSGNPGASSFFEYCDTMIEFENNFSVYNGIKTLASITSDGGNLNQSAVLTLKVSTSLTAMELATMVITMHERGVQLVGFTNDCCYGNLNATLLSLMAAACNNASSVDSAVAQAAMVSAAVPSELVSGYTKMTLFASLLLATLRIAIAG